MNLYNASFYQSQAGGSAQSAENTVPIVLSLVRPASVIDIGCGVGTWLSCFRASGVQDILGIDGPYVNKKLLRIPADCFLPHDLTQPVSLSRVFDLALCLEVAEHLPEKRARTLVADLAALAPAILFSAAVPGQGGTGHLNEQWPVYWRDLFEQNGYQCLDCIRPRIWDNDAIEPWYRQNLLLFVRRDRVSDYADAGCPAPLSIAHPALFETRVQRSLPVLLAALKDKLFEIARRRLRRRRSSSDVTWVKESST